jgi:SpoVK/Ycf46/Vps4 family AAA+-type ATPase
MAAALIAKELHTAIYQIDLSKIVSKWIGETEKNLATLFDAAEAGQVILLFDEADALFGKRTDVKSSNDRHANQEVNFLLQRLETFSGVCILTTNHEIAMDEAFRRRLALHVRFTMPEAAERRRLWESMIPSNAPTAGNLGIDKLAQELEMSGGYIRNAVVRAAFIAASENGPINAARLTIAARREYEAMGKVIATR